MKQCNRKYYRLNQQGFTIVELLIVVVVIAILAAIIIVAYNGVSRSAIESAMKSDLRNAGTVVATDKATNGTYPSDADSANSGKGLRAGNNSSLLYIPKPDGYCLSISNPAIPQQFRLVSNIGQIEEGSCDVVASTIAGSGTTGLANGNGTTAQFTFPRGSVIASDGTMYVTEINSGAIRKISPGGEVTTLPLSGTISNPVDVALNPAGILFVSESNRITRIDASGQLTVVAGSGSSGWVDNNGVSARFSTPQGLAFSNSGDLYIADYNNSRIRKMSPSGEVTTFAGSGIAGWSDGTGTAAQFNRPTDLAMDSAGNIYVADLYNQRIRKITPDGTVTTIAGTGTPGSTDGTGTAAQLNYPYGLAVDATNTIFVADAFNHRIRKIMPNGTVSTIVGASGVGYVDGNGSQARLRYPYAISTDASGNLYVSDSGNYRIRKIVQ